MDDNRDKLLDDLFAAARKAPPEIFPGEAHFETRLMARLAERARDAVPWHRMVWRMVPAFVAIAIFVLVCSISLNPARSSDPFAAITSGAEDQMARNYLLGE